MPGPLTVEAGDRTAEELLDALREGRRVVVETDVLGSTHEITLRRDGDRYYCDTPTTLHTHDSIEEMRECIVEQGYGVA